MRSHHDLVYRLSTCQVFCCIDVCSTEKLSLTNDYECSTMILRKSIQCIILELIALELSSLLRSNHIEQPKRLITALLQNLVQVQNYTAVESTTFASTPPNEEEKGKNLIITILQFISSFKLFYGLCWNKV